MTGSRQSRSRRHRSEIAASIFMPAIAALSLSAAANEVASAAEAQRLVAGATVDFSHGGHHLYEYYAADGTSRGGDGAGMRGAPGHWRVRPDGSVCFLHDDPNQSGCVFVVRDGAQMAFHRYDGVVEGPFNFERGNPHGL